VINLSLAFSATLNSAVANAVKAGIVVVVAAGNNNEDADATQPRQRAVRAHGRS
jgi:subtilisin family serine protease